MPWLQLHIAAHNAQVGRIEAALESLGALSVTLGDAADQPLLEPGPGETPLWAEVTITGLFEGETDPEALRAALEKALPEDHRTGLRLEALEDQPWERAWMADFHPMRFGERLWIRPTHCELDEPGAVVVDLDPGLAFGTGTHPTTALCLTWLDQAGVEGTTIADFGCGSGILGIAALKLGAARVIAVDHDPQALSATLDNARQNGVEARIDVRGHRDPVPEQVDIVLANILANTLVELAPLLTAMLKPGGRIVLSGILREQAGQVSAAYTTACAMDPPWEQGDWVLIAGRKHT